MGVSASKLLVNHFGGEGRWKSGWPDRRAEKKGFFLHVSTISSQNSPHCAMGRMATIVASLIEIFYWREIVFLFKTNIRLQLKSLLSLNQLQFFTFPDKGSGNPLG